MRLELRDQGEGWFWDSPKIVVHAAEQVTMPRQGAFVKVEFHSPLERQEPDGSTLSGLHLVVYSGAWIRSRWQEHDISPQEETSVFMWLIERGKESDGPPREKAPSTWALCRVVA